jgi:hypothetical protein
LQAHLTSIPVCPTAQQRRCRYLSARSR